MDQRDGVRIRARYPILVIDPDTAEEYPTYTLNFARSVALIETIGSPEMLGKKLELVYEDLSKCPLSQYRKKGVVSGTVHRLDRSGFVVHFTINSELEFESVNRLRLTAFNQRSVP